MYNRIPKLDDLKDLAKEMGLSVEEYARLFIQYNTITSQELAEDLGVAQPRIAALKKSGKIIEVKKGIFLTKDAMNMRFQQLTSDSLKHSVSSTEYHILPARYSLPTDTNKRVLFISKTRFSDCLVMADNSSDSDSYIKELKELLHEIIQLLKEDGIIFPLIEQDFRKFKDHKQISVNELNVYNQSLHRTFTLSVGLTPNDLFNWLARCKLTLKNQNLIKEVNTVMEVAKQLILDNIKLTLKRTYEFSEIDLIQNNRVSLIFSFVALDKTIGKIKIIKSTRRIAFWNNQEWIFDKKNMMAQEINI